MDRRVRLVDEHLDHGLRDGIRTDADSIDIVVGQIDRFIAEQLATPLDRELVVRFAGGKDLVHRNALHKPASVVVGRRARDVEGFAETSRVNCADEGLLPSSSRAFGSRDGGRVGGAT
jgi:hypothetical protein